MDSATLQRLFGWSDAFNDDVTCWIVLAVVVLLGLAPVIMLSAQSVARIKQETKRELRRRYVSWCVIAPLMVVPVLLGGAWTILAIAALGLAGYREYARATGLFRSKLVHLATLIGTLVTYFAIIDHWYNFFTALMPLGIGTIAAAGLLGDRPRGYIQRVALGIFGFMLFGPSLGSLAYIANDASYRPIILIVLLCVELNDVFAFITGRLFGRRKLAPQTSPGKTTAGSLGALVLTTLLFFFAGRALFEGTILATWPHLLAIGIIISSTGQIGDLVVSSIKRDLGIKDMGQLIPGHGGLLDRFDSLLLVAPAFFHYVGYFLGFGWDQSTRIISKYLF